VGSRPWRFDSSQPHKESPASAGLSFSALGEISSSPALILAGKTATGIEVPPEVVEGLGSGKKPPVRVTIGGHTYRSTVAARGERFLIGVSAENREKARVAADAEVEVEIELQAKSAETRQRRIAKAVGMLQEGRKR
jgi:Domain of unknown function (DUF1905)